MPYGCVYSETYFTSGIGGRSRLLRGFADAGSDPCSRGKRKREREPTSHHGGEHGVDVRLGATRHAQRSCANGKLISRVPRIVRSRGACGNSRRNSNGRSSGGLLSEPAKSTDCRRIGSRWAELARAAMLDATICGCECDVA